jgi:hypothetical protein
MTYLSKCALLVIFVSPISTANSLLDELAMCAKNTDSLQRLVCYDKLANDTKSKPPKQPQVTSKDSIVERVDSIVKVAPKIQPEKVLAVSNHHKKPAVAEPQSVVVVIANSVKQQQASFGKEAVKRPEDRIKQLKAKVVKIQKAPYGELIITVENGQVWRQTDSTRFRLSKDEMVIIERGVLGSFFIGKENSNQRIRAKRVK